MEQKKPHLRRSRNGPYRKYIYWLQPEEVAELRECLTSQGIKVKAAKGVVCSPLDAFNRISTIDPEVWNETCRRAGAWYQASPKNGLHLVVSAGPLPGYERHLSAVLEESDFVPPRLAEKEEQLDLFEDPLLKARIPPAWFNVTEREKQIYLRWAHRMGSKESDFEPIFLTQTANHGNFIHPRFYVEREDRIVPYSIDRTAHLCSCCLEVYQIVGETYPVKLVAPCPGAAVFARLKPDRYLLVRAAAVLQDSRPAIEPSA